MSHDDPKEPIRLTVKIDRLHLGTSKYTIWQNCTYNGEHGTCIAFGRHALFLRISKTRPRELNDET